MSDDIWVAIIGALGGGALLVKLVEALLDQLFNRGDRQRETFRSWEEKRRKEIDSERKELKQEISDLRKELNTEIDELRAEVEEWKAKYYELYDRHIQLVAEYKLEAARGVELSERLAALSDAVNKGEENGSY